MIFEHRKVPSSSLSWLIAQFQKAYEGEIWCLYVPFGQKVPKLNSRPTAYNITVNKINKFPLSFLIKSLFGG